MTRYFTVTTLVAVNDDGISHEALYELLPKLASEGAREVYADVAPGASAELLSLAGVQ